MKKLSLWKKILLALLTVLLIFLLINIKLVSYGIQQGLGQLEMVRNAVEIDSLLADKNYPDSLKRKLLIIKDVRRFAIDSLGLKNSPNYNAVYDLKGRATAYVVQAAEKYRIKKYVWKFPVVGSLPYKGYFDENDAKKEAESLKKQGYDTRIVNPGGWSTMGWFKDPILSDMLRKDEASLAELIIHELTHSTVFVKDNSELNENIADYAGENGAKLYLKSKYGENSSVITKYVNSIEDNLTLANYFLHSAKKLDSLYCTDVFLSLSDSLKDVEKQKFIAQIIDGIDGLNFKAFDKTKIKKDRLKNVNNTFFTGYMTYYNKKESLENQKNTEFNGDFLKQLEFLKQKYGR
jgi:predicted aminopeptidase